ncbi:MAG: ABC transporter permease [Promicromonosporaceae bacterium]|nr:ABC transporter permease [Promicromonosporaceae bacterium]
MLAFFGRRLGVGILMIFVVGVLAFSLLYLTSGDIARNLLGDLASEEVVRARAAEMGLDRPLIAQFGTWLADAVRGNFGQSWFRAASVSELLATRLTVTLSLVLLAVGVSAIVATVLGVAAATRAGGIVDRVVQFVSLLGVAIPSFLIALALVLVFAINLGWLNPTGFVQPSESVGGWLASVLLPVLALCSSGVAGAAQQVRGAMIDVLGQDYVRTLRAGGVPARSVIYKHTLRNAAGPGISVLGLQFIGMMGGAVVIENLFVIPGLGTLSAQSTMQGDIPVIMGVVVTIAIIVILVNLIIDLIQGWLNPKVRVE